MFPFHTATSIHVTSIELNVTHLEDMIKFYTSQLGLTLLEQTSTSAQLGTSERMLITLHATPSVTRLRSAGLYHVALLLETREEFACFYVHAMTHDLLDGVADHGVSEALYLTDPEGNGIEVYVDRPSSEWPYLNGQLAMSSDPLRSRELYRLATAPFTKMRETTRIGHLHLHVRNLVESERFYHQLGFAVMQHFGTSAAFLGHQGYHHHIGMNTWLGHDLPPHLLTSGGLSRVTFSYPTAEFYHLLERYSSLQRADSLEIMDPNGIQLRILHHPS